MADESDVRFAAIINMPSVENVVENRVHITSDPHMRDTWLMEMKEADKRREGWGSELYKSFREESGQMLRSAVRTFSKNLSHPAMAKYSTPQQQILLVVVVSGVA